MAALAIAAGIFAISFGFVADADRNTPPAAAAPGAPRHEVSSPGTAAPRVALGSAVALGVRPSLLARPVRRAPVRRVAPAPTPDRSLPSTPPTDVPGQPVSPSNPVGAVPTTPVPAPAPTPAPPPKPAPKPVAKPAPKPAAKPKPPDFDDTGPPAPGKRKAGGG